MFTNTPHPKERKHHMWENRYALEKVLKTIKPSEKQHPSTDLDNFDRGNFWLLMNCPFQLAILYESDFSIWINMFLENIDDIFNSMSKIHKPTVSRAR